MLEKKLKILAVETSTNLGGVSFLENDKVLYLQTSSEQKKHSELVHHFIERGFIETNLKLADFDIFAVSSGPGSFTGIRVAVNTGKTFSYIHKKPLVGISSLACLAFQNMEEIVKASQSLDTPICHIFCMINAFKNMIYFAKFHLNIPYLIEVKSLYQKISNLDLINSLTFETAPQVIPVKDLGKVLTQTSWILGDGFATYNNFFPQETIPFLKRIESSSDYPLASSLGILAYHHFVKNYPSRTFEWNLFTPLYLRASEAEENKKGILYSPL